MKEPIQRKKRRGQRLCPIDVNSLYRHWDWGDKRIDWPRISALLERWNKGEKIPWRKLSHTFIKPGRRVPRERTELRTIGQQADGETFWDIMDEYLGVDHRNQDGAVRPAQHWGNDTYTGTLLPDDNENIRPTNITRNPRRRRNGG